MGIYSSINTSGMCGGTITYTVTSSWNYCPLELLSRMRRVSEGSRVAILRVSYS